MFGWTPKRNNTRILVGLLIWTMLACATTKSNHPQVDPFSVSLPKVGGGRIYFEHYRGKVLMVDFFNTWSQASLFLVPGYTALYEKYKEKGLMVVGVALDKLEELVVEPYARGMQISYPIAIADKNVREGNSSFGNIMATPTLMIFARNGQLVKIILGQVPIQQVEKIIEQCL